MHNNWLTVLALPMTVMAAPGFATEYLAIEQAQQLIFTDADVFVEHLVKLSETHKDQIKEISGKKQRWDEQRIWQVQKQDQDLGWFIIDNVVGKHEFITYGVGISPDSHVMGVEIMTYRETHGDEVREQEWREHFTDKTVNDAFKLNEDIPNITGATLSARNVTDGVKRLLALHQVVLSSE
jgi:electron transport complex protein RnfG